MPRHNVISFLSLAGVVLDGLGGLYLAYDLLGGQRGSLRTFTKAASYGVMFGLVYGLPLGQWFGLAGLLVSGPVLSIEIGQRGLLDPHQISAAMVLGLLRAASFGAAGWLAKDPQFGVSFGILSAIGFVASYLIVGPPSVANRRRARIDRTVMKRAVLRGASIGLAAVLAGLIQQENRAIAYGIEVGVVTGTSSGILLAVAPAVEAWVERLPDRRLGGYGAFLVMIGSLLQTLQYVLPLLGWSM